MTITSAKLRGRGFASTMEGQMAETKLTEAAKARLFIRNYLIERDAACGFHSDEDEWDESAREIFDGIAALSSVQPVPGVKPLLAIEVLREWFGRDRYARDYEYLDANYMEQAERVAAFSALPTPQPVEGPSEPVAYCQPMKDGEHQPRQFIVWFEDRDKGIATFDDEAEARAYWENANINGNFYLFGALSRDATPSLQAQGTVERAEAVAWLDMRSEPAADWTKRVVVTNPEFVAANGAENFAPLGISVASKR